MAEGPSEEPHTARGSRDLETDRREAPQELPDGGAEGWAEVTELSPCLNG